MHSLLKEKLRSYIQENNPDLLHSLQSEYQLSYYLEDKVSQVMPLVLQMLDEGKVNYAIEELALNELTKELRPSKCNYLKKVLQEDFPDDYQRLYRLGVLTFETINLVDECKEVFEAFSFSVENENDHLLRHAIIAKVHEYLN
jgi:hypothetical protein